MELILISSNKLKVILSEKEMEKYGLHYAVATDKKHLNSLLTDIKKKSGFNTDNGSIYVEMFESLDGGCEIFITREVTSVQKAGAGAPKKSSVESIITYKFNSAEDIISASKILFSKKLKHESRLFCDERGFFYLLLTFAAGFNSNSAELIFLNDFGALARERYIREYLDEHGRLICVKDAVETLAKI